MQNPSDCHLTRDLLVYYDDNLLSDTSMAFVDNHLQHCTECQKWKENYSLKSQQAHEFEAAKEKGFVRLLKKRRFELLGVIIGYMAIFLILASLILFAFLRPEESNREEYHQISDYGKQHYRGISSLALFPNANQISGTITDFYYSSEGNALYQDYQIYLEIRYSEDDYQIEKQRLTTLRDSATGKSVIYTEDETCLPCIYSMLYDEGYEYALFEEDTRTIYYIYLQTMDRDEIHFDTSFLPKDYGQKGLATETERDSYRIYQKE